MTKAKFIEEQPEVKVTERDGMYYIFICLNGEWKEEKMSDTTERFWECDYNEIVTDDIDIEDVRENPDDYIDYDFRNSKGTIETRLSALLKAKKITKDERDYVLTGKRSVSLAKSLTVEQENVTSVTSGSAMDDTQASTLSMSPLSLGRSAAISTDGEDGGEIKDAESVDEADEPAEVEEPAELPVEENTEAKPIESEIRVKEPDAEEVIYKPIDVTEPDTLEKEGGETD